MSKESPQGEPLVILLVEDDPAHAELVMRNLQEHRIANRVHHVADGETALDYLFRRGPYVDPEKSPRPHIVLLDLRLPGIDGLEVAKTIKTTKELMRIPVVVLTTSDAKPDVNGAYDEHVNSYLVKPLGFEQFRKMMNNLGFYWLGWNQNPWP